MHHALRSLLKSPGFTAVAVLTLALGIGANTAIFGLVDGVLLTPPPFPQPDRIVGLRCRQPALDWPVVADFHEYLDWKEQTDVFSDVMVYNGFGSQVLVDDSGARSLNTPTVSANFLRTLGLHPLLGRDFTDADCVPNSNPVALLGYAVWNSQFYSDPAAIGRTVKLGGRAVTIIGVLPEGFASVTPGERPMDMLMPLTYTRETANRGSHHLWVYARMKDGVGLVQAQQRMNEVALRLQKERDISHGIVTLTLQDWSNQWVRSRLLMLMGAAALMLLIACVNISNLQLVRITGRTAEISVKMALGAGRGRIARELLLESLLAGLAGTVVGCALAVGTLALAGSFLKSQFATFAGLHVGWRALLFSGGISLLTVILSSLAPVWCATVSWGDSLRTLGRSATARPGQRRLNNLFIVAQVGLTMVALVGAGLLGRSMYRLLTQEKGFATENISVFRVALPDATYGKDAAKRLQFYSQLLERIQALPGISAATSGDNIPLRAGTNGTFSVPGINWVKGQVPVADKFIVSPQFFKTFGVPLLKGRNFDPSLDRLPGKPGPYPAAVIINESFARKYYGDKDPVGQRIASDNESANSHPDFVWDTVVGVVADARMVSLDREVGPAIFISTQQLPVSLQFVAVRSALDPAALLPVLREQLRSLDPALPLTQLKTMQVIFDETIAQRRLITWTIVGAAALALGLTMLGLYSVIAYTVAQQTREIGVRLAIGAQPGVISRWVLSHGLRLVLAGVLLGAAGSYGVAQLLGSLIYGVSAWDPLTYGAVATLLILVALLACWLPARRAARIDPLIALRAE